MADPQQGLAKQYYNWLLETYGWFVAENQITREAGLFQWGYDKNSPYFQHFKTEVLPTLDQVNPEQQATSMLPSYQKYASVSFENAISTLLPQGFGTDAISFSGTSYIERLESFLNRVVYGGGMGEQQRDDYLERAVKAILGGVPAEQLPYFENLQQQDYNQWSDYQVRNFKSYALDETRRQQLIGEVRQAESGVIDPEQSLSYSQELQNMSVPELEYVRQLQDWTQKGTVISSDGVRRTYEENLAWEEKDDQRQRAQAEYLGAAANLRQQELLSGRARPETQEEAAMIASSPGYREKQLTQAKEAARAAGTQTAPYPSIGELTRRQFNSLMRRSTPMTSETIQSQFEGKPAMGQFYSGGKGQAVANKYNKALVEWNMNLAAILAQNQQEEQWQGSVDTSQIVYQEGTPYYASAPGDPDEKNFGAVPQEFESAETWAGKYDWYKEFIATPPQWRPGGGQGKALSPRAKWAI